MMRGNKRIQWKAVESCFCTLVFLFTIILTVSVTYYLSEHFLQGDISSDLVYANHLYENGRLVSEDWYGSSELRIMRAEWVFAPLFMLFDDWHMVRFTGTLIMQGLIVASFGYLLLQVHADRNSFFLGASALLVPYCFSYGINVLYGCFYATFVSISFFSIALFVSLITGSPVCRAGKTACLCLLGFITSLGGPRVLLNMAAPAFLLILYIHAHDLSAFTDVERKGVRQGIRISAVYAACAGAGYLINSGYLADRFHFSSSSFELGFALTDRLEEMLTSILYSFGFQNELPLTSIRGMVALACAVVCLFYLGWNMRSCLHWQKENAPAASAGRVFIGLFGFSALLVMVAFKLLTTDDHSNDTYYILITMWVIPWASLMLDRVNTGRMRTVAVLVLLVLYLSGLVNMLSFLFPMRYRQYTNITFHHMELADQISPSCEYLKKEGWTHGYASFWNANVITEKTDGAVHVTNATALPGRDELMGRYYWLCDQETMNRVSDRSFILLSQNENQAVSQNEDMNAVRQIYADEHFVIYEILDPENVYNGLIR